MIYLASNSPRRAELLQQINVPFKRVKGDIEEQRANSETTENYVLRLALQKAQAGFNNSDQTRPVLGADTIVVVDHEILEKPQNQAHAMSMLQLLSGRTHQVFTAIAIVSRETFKTQLVKTDVTFKLLTEQEMEAYWLTGEPIDKAGGYGIQGYAGKFVSHINGSYSAVVGLPLYETDQLINEFYRI
ncbi:Maf family protein [Psychromonas sp. MME2]|uniref:Maf family protein n=1 Tax=unclassified Psychromonas TaxID=2614957 RepID=UPI00339C5B57